MSSDMRILGWKARGLRCPDHEINCLDSNGQPFPVSLIQMPNGTGKTTTLTLLRTTLSGAASDSKWDQQKIKGFQKRNSKAAEGFFEVRLLLNKKRATIVMDFDFETGQVFYRTTYGSGQRSGFDPPSEFRRFLNESFINFYIFDGELAQHLLDRNYTNAQQAVENLFQLNAFEEMSQKVGEYWENNTKNVGTSSENGLSRRQKRLAKLKKRLSECRDKYRDIQKRRANSESRLQKREEAYLQEIRKEDKRRKALSFAETKVERARSKVREEALDVLDRMRDPHALSSTFARSMIDLKNGLDKVKLPESVASEFFEDLASEKECVCGRPIDTEIAATIRARAVQYLGADDVSLLNSMKTEIKDAVNEPADEAEKDLAGRMAVLTMAAKEERSARNDRDALRHEAEQSDPVIKTVLEDIKNLKKDIKGFSDELEKFESKDDKRTDDRTYGIEILERRINDAERKIAEITNTLKEKIRRDTLKAIIGNAYNRALEGIATDLRDKTNARISELMPHNDISIDRIEQHLILNGQEGGSVGETLSIAYAFLATLFHRSDCQIPFVVDSPAGPIDLAVRPKIGRLIPKLTAQFIAFTNSSERSRFVAPLKQSSQTDIQFITLFRKNFTMLKHWESGKDVFLETDDGLNVAGEDFFNEFQIEEEGDA